LACFAQAARLTAAPETLEISSSRASAAGVITRSLTNALNAPREENAMHMTFQRTTGRGLVMVSAAAVMMVATLAQAGPPALSTNPGNLAIFPAKGQTPEQQRADESAAYDWATQQTRWDPYQAKAVLDQQGNAAAASANAARGGAVKGGAGGALLGAAIGAVAGDAGKGAAIGATSLGLTGGVRSRRAVKAAGGSSDAAVAAYQQQFGVWTRNFMAAMEAKGYTVR
jgi:hypothetical protein